MKDQIAKVLFPVAALLCLFPFVSSAVALALGVFLAVTLGNPFLHQTRQYTHHLLSWSVVGLGAGMDLMVVARVGLQGIGYTVVGISLTLLAGFLLARFLKIERNTGVLISVGTAICGGSAIAAVSPVIRAKPAEVSVSLGTVFMLNACALLLFPLVGHSLSLSQTQFGLWSALAIHDTSSVVGATLLYGAEALQIGMTVKLARALWIVPLALAIGYVFNRRSGLGEDQGKTKKPWFILGFLAMAAVVTWVPALQPAGHVVEMVAKRTLVLTLFLIGANLTRETLKSVGLRPLLQGVLLWVIAASATLAAVYAGWIS